MKKLIASIAAVALAFASHAASPAATQAWVMKYCATLGMTATNTTRGTAYTYGDGTNALTFIVSRPTAYAIYATNCAPAAISAGITDGMMFAYHRPCAVFLNEPAGKRIWIDVSSEDLSRTYIFGAFTSMKYGGYLWMVDSATNRMFRLVGTSITDRTAHSLTNGFIYGGDL